MARRQLILHRVRRTGPVAVLGQGLKSSTAPVTSWNGRLARLAPSAVPQTPAIRVGIEMVKFTGDVESFEAITSGKRSWSQPIPVEIRAEYPQEIAPLAGHSPVVVVIVVVVFSSKQLHQRQPENCVAALAHLFRTRAGGLRPVFGQLLAGRLPLGLAVFVLRVPRLAATGAGRPAPLVTQVD